MVPRDKGTRPIRDKRAQPTNRPTLVSPKLHFYFPTIGEDNGDMIVKRGSIIDPGEGNERRYLEQPGEGRVVAAAQKSETSLYNLVKLDVCARDRFQRCTLKRFNETLLESRGGISNASIKPRALSVQLIIKPNRLVGGARIANNNG